MNRIPRLGQLTALPKLGEILDDEHPCIRPLTEDELHGICTRLGTNREYIERFNNFDYDQLAKALPARYVAKLLLTDDLLAREALELATMRAQEILENDDSTTQELLFAIRAVCELWRVRVMSSECLLREAERAEEAVKQERPRRLTRRTLSL